LNVGLKRQVTALGLSEKYRLKLSARVGMRRVTLSWDEYAFIDIRDLTFMFSDVERDKGMVMAEAKGMAGLGNRGYL
jgi:hypothetical protein